LSCLVLPFLLPPSATALKIRIRSPRPPSLLWAGKRFRVNVRRAARTDGRLSVEREVAMIESGWLACSEPEGTLELLQGKASERKLRLFAIACCRRIWGRINDGRSRAAVEFAEQFAEVGLARRGGRAAVERAAQAACREAEAACRQAEAACWEAEATGWGAAAARRRKEAGITYATRMIFLNASKAALHTLAVSIWFSAPRVAKSAANALGWETMIRSHPWDLPAWLPSAAAAEQEEQFHLLRDLFGPPGGPRPLLDPAWLGRREGAAHKLARAIYDERAFDHLPVLADALEDAGCGDAEILGHCRDGWPHVRGCWVVDLLLGKR
jgi:hypothetical protein